MRLDAATECAGENARVNSSKMVLMTFCDRA